MGRDENGLQGEVPVKLERVDGRYDVFGESLLSVTTIIDRLNRYGLNEWPVRTAVDYVVNELYVPMQKGWLTSAQFLETDVNKVVECAIKRSEDTVRQAMSVGTKTHAAIAGYYSGGRDKECLEKAGAYNGMVRDCLTAFRTFDKAYNIIPIEVESTAYSVKHRYAGTYDLDCTATLPGSGTLVRAVVDFKTGAFRQESIMQLSAYIEALEEQGLGPYDVGMVIQLDAESKTAKVHVYKRQELKTPFKMFLAIKDYCHLEEQWREEK